MSDLPAGWEWTTLGDVLDGIEAGRSFGGPARPAADGEWGIVKVSAMTSGRFKAEENKALPSNIPIDDRHIIRPGDVLLSRANTEALVGASVLVGELDSKLLLSDKSLRLVVSDAVESRYLVMLLCSPLMRRSLSLRASGTKDSMRNISQALMRTLEIPLPPLCEQRRIVAFTEQLLSGLEVGETDIRRISNRVRGLTSAILSEAVPLKWPASWKRLTVAGAGRVDLGRQRHPDWHHGSNMKPYLRVANVFEDRIDLSDVMEMHFTSAEFDRFRLVPGDILLNEGQSPEYLRRPAMYRGDPVEVAFTNSLLRFRAGPEVLPEWALLVFRHHMRSGRFMREVRITTNIAHLSAGRFKSVEFPVPPLAEQQRLVDQVKERLGDAARLVDAARLAQARATALRRAVLTDAFAGRLVPQDPADEPASVLLDRIRAERPEPTRRRSTRR